MRQQRRHPYLDYPRPIAFAHRGGGLEAEENTMPAFERAVSLGFTHVELDVHATRDGVVVIHHDDTLERMAGDPRAIADLDWSELSTVATRGGASIPRLDELFLSFPTLNVNIEPKSDRVIEPLVELIRRAKVLPRVGIGCFDPRRTGRLCELLGEGLCWSPAHAGVLRLWLAGWGLPVAVGSFPMVQVPTHFRGIPVVTPRFLRVAHRRGIHVQVWTIDEAPEMERLVDMGVDAIMSDRPSLLREVLQRRGKWPAG
jgi:glycerophosphoryl diester phosphodiesterase